jgi:8-oxo-dGTP diphosphatase
LSPVQQTVSHPGVIVLGWDKFRVLSDTTSLPVFALGGVSLSDMKLSWKQGAQGIAAISAFWDTDRSVQGGRE